MGFETLANGGTTGLEDEFESSLWDLKHEKLVGIFGPFVRLKVPYGI